MDSIIDVAVSNASLIRLPWSAGWLHKKAPSIIYMHQVNYDNAVFILKQ